MILPDEQEKKDLKSLDEALESGDIDLVRKCVREIWPSDETVMTTEFVLDRINYTEFYSHHEVSVLLEALEKEQMNNTGRLLANCIFRSAFQTNDLELARIAMPYALTYCESLEFVCDREPVINGSADMLDDYLFLRQLGVTELDSLLQYADNLLEKRREESAASETQQALFEAYMKSRAMGGSAHDRFVEILFPHIYNSDYFGEALTEALEHKDAGFLSLAADMMFKQASTLEEIAEVHAIAQASDNWRVEEQTRAMLTEYDDAGEEIQGLGSKLAEFAPIRKLAAELRDKMQEKLGINYPKTILFTPFTGQYASIDYEGFNTYGIGTKTGNEAGALAALVD